MKQLSEYKIGEVVPVFHWGKPDRMKIVEIMPQSNKVKVQHLDAQGSCYYTPEDLERMEDACEDYYNKAHRKKYPELWADDTDAFGNNYSDADPGL